MLMIIEQLIANVLTFKLAGALSGEWALEFKRCWNEAKRSLNGTRVVVDLTDVTFVDDAGKELLRSLTKEGAELLARDILTRSIVEEIKNESSMS